MAPNENAQNDLDARVKAARLRNRMDLPQADPLQPRDGDKLGPGARIGIEFVAAMIVSVGIGVMLDRWWHSTPAALLVMLVLGFGAGLLNIYRAMKGMGYADTYRSVGRQVPGQKSEMDKAEEKG